MAIMVNSNIASLNAQRNLSKSQGSLSTALQRLSSGLRINSAKDDAAGLYTSELMTKTIRGSNQAARNAQDGVSYAQVAEGALAEISNNLQRIREIAVQAASGLVEDRTGLNAEVTQLKEANTKILSDTKFNGTAVLATASFSVHVGAEAGDVLSSTTTAASASVGTVDSAANAVTAIGAAEAAIKSVAQARARFGAIQNRFETIVSNLHSLSENTSAARSRILDADFAAETAALTRAKILQQAGVSIVAQANTLPQAALTLLG